MEEKGASMHLERVDGDVGLEDGQQAKTSRIVRKLDRHLLPIITALYFASYLDRGNIGNAKTAGTQKDLNLSDEQWTWVLYSFYIVYTLLEWTIIFWKLFPAHIYCMVLCLGWSTAAICCGAVNTFSQLAACRALLGMFEAAFGAGAVYFLTLFYHREELGVRLSLVLGTSPLANCIASALAYGITQIRAGIEPWRLLFIIEGSPALFLMPVVFFLLPDSLSTAKFLTEDERTLAKERLQVIDRTEKTRVSWKQYFAGLGDVKNYAHALMHFCCNYSFAGLSNFLPTIAVGFGYSSVNAQGIIAPVYFAAFLVSMIAAWLSDRVKCRGLFVSCLSALAAVGYLLLAVVENDAARYAGVWLACVGIFPALALNVTWLFNNQGGETKKGAGFAILTTIGQCSSFVSSSAYPSTQAPYYVRGSAIGCGLSGLISLVSMGLHLYLRRENRKREEKFGPVDRNALVDVTDGRNDSRHFRYMT